MCKWTSDQPTKQTNKRPFSCFAATGHLFNSIFMNVANESRVSNQSNERASKRQTNKWMNYQTNKQTSEQMNRKSEGKSISESFKLWDFLSFSNQYLGIFLRFFIFLLVFWAPDKQCNIFLSLLAQKQRYIFFSRKEEKI
jgi:hypothetical protein